MVAVATVPVHVIWLMSLCIGMGIAGKIISCIGKVETKDDEKHSVKENIEDEKKSSE